MSQAGEEAATNNLARLREAARHCKVLNLKATPAPEAELIRLQFIAGLRDSGSKLKSLEVLRVNNNLTIEELLQLIEYSTQAKDLLRAQFISHV